MVKIIKALSIVIISTIFSYFTFGFFGKLYIEIFNPSGSWLNFSDLHGLPTAYTLLVFFLIPIVFPKPNKWLFIILSIPAIAFEIMFDPLRIYFPFIFGLVGLVVGLLIRKAINRFI